MPRIANRLLSGVVCLAFAMVAFETVRPRLRDDSHSPRDETAHFAHTNIGGPADSSQDISSPGPTPFSVLINKPAGPPRIELAGTDPQGRTGSVACSTCHAIRQPNYANVSATTLDEFHQGMTFSHGTIACYACHNPDDADALRLADGTRIAYENVMTLCSQCHGPQATAFSHGAHGGMNGFWDLSRGSQTKNNCIDCHDPHAPSYPKMIVGFKPKDRFNQPSEHDQEHAGAESHDGH